MPTYAVNWSSFGAALIQATDEAEAKEIFEDNAHFFIGEEDDWQIDDVEEVKYE